MKLLATKANMGSTLERWRQDPDIARTSAALRSMGHDYPQYKYLARPLNRLLGGPYQPLTSALGATYLTDLAMHQSFVLIGQAVALRDASRLVPRPTFTTYQLLSMGYPVALAKLSQFHQHLVIRELAKALLPDADTALRDELATRLASLTKGRPYLRPSPRERQAIIDFITSIESELSGPAQHVILRLRMGDQATLAQAESLWDCVGAYRESRTDANFDAMIRKVERCCDMSPVRVSQAVERGLLAQDLAKASILGVLVAVQWMVFARRLVAGDMLACLEAIVIGGGCVSTLLARY